MVILTAEQTRAADALTCQTQGISSLELMERAASAVVHDLLGALYYPEPVKRVVVCCGPGNNGGDGLAVARRLAAPSSFSTYTVEVYYLTADRYSPDWLANRERLPADVQVVALASEADFPMLAADALVVDALFGTGLSRPLEGLAAALVQYLNAGPGRIYAIDVPSGMLTDGPNPAGTVIIQATETATFQAPKLPFLLPRTGPLAGQWRVLDIGLDLSQTTPHLFYTKAVDVAPLLQPRPQFAHKGTYGHALLLAGARGKMGAAVLATRACLRSGVGLLTVQVPAVGYDILQLSAPEAMCLTDPMRDHLTALATDDGLSAYRAIGIGPGIGQHADTALLLREVLDEAHRRGLGLVLDADALNLLGQHPHWLRHLPARTVLTPHLKEFERLAGPAADDFARLTLLRKFCAEYRCYVILKGAHSVLGTPDGRLYFNSTGNAGMATGGTGDVLTGIVLGLLCEGLDAEDAARLAMLVHGEAGDLVRRQHGERGLTAGLLLETLGQAFLALEQHGKDAEWSF